MAKIYETKDDFKRDMLDEQAKNLRLEAANKERRSANWMVLSFLPNLLDMSGIRVAKWVHWLANITAIGSVIGFVSSWKTNSRAHDLELERERMGPQHVVLPANAAPELAETCAPCALKKLGIEPKTLTEHAQTSESPLRQL